MPKKLKIKENVSLEKLKERGFSNNEDELYYDVFDGWICVDKKTRELYISTEIPDVDLVAGDIIIMSDIGFLYELFNMDIIELDESK